MAKKITLPLSILVALIVLFVIVVLILINKNKSEPLVNMQSSGIFDSCEKDNNVSDISEDFNFKINPPIFLATSTFVRSIRYSELNKIIQIVTPNGKTTNLIKCPNFDININIQGISPDGKSLAITYFNYTEDKEKDLPTQKEGLILISLESPYTITELIPRKMYSLSNPQWSSDANYLTYSIDQKYIQVWDVKTGKSLMKEEGEIYKWLDNQNITYVSDEKLYKFNIKTLNKEIITEGVRDYFWSPNEKYIAYTGSSSLVMFNVESKDKFIFANYEGDNSQEKNYIKSISWLNDKEFLFRKNGYIKSISIPTYKIKNYDGISSSNYLLPNLQFGIIKDGTSLYDFNNNREVCKLESYREPFKGTQDNTWIKEGYALLSRNIGNRHSAQVHEVVYLLNTGTCEEKIVGENKFTNIASFDQTSFPMFDELIKIVSLIPDKSKNPITYKNTVQNYQLTLPNNVQPLPTETDLDAHLYTYEGALEIREIDFEIEKDAQYIFDDLKNNDQNPIMLPKLIPGAFVIKSQPSPGVEGWSSTYNVIFQKEKKIFLIHTNSLNLEKTVLPNFKLLTN